MSDAEVAGVAAYIKVRYKEVVQRNLGTVKKVLILLKFLLVGSNPSLSANTAP